MVTGRTETKMKEVTMYEAQDGQQFRTADAAQAHEEKLALTSLTLALSVFANREVTFDEADAFVEKNRNALEARLS
jgi:hypothetical protein